ncbi:hypothetical protein D3C76_737320 [compost metagenome]
MAAGNQRPHLITGTERLATRAPYFTQRHFFNEGDINAQIDGVLHQRQHLIEIAPLHHHTVEFDPIEPGRACRFDSPQHLSEIAVAGNRAKALAVQAVEADVHAFDPGIHQRSGQALQLRAIAGHHQFTQARQGGNVTAQIDNPRTDQRLPSGQADLAHPLANEQRCQTLQFLKGEYLLTRQEGHVLGHAVHTAKITTIGHRHTQIIDLPPESILHHRAHHIPLAYLVTAPAANQRPVAGYREYPQHRSGSAGTEPPPSATRPVAAGCGSPWRPPHTAIAGLRCVGRR